MTAHGRLDHLEGGLPPKEATLAWLEEAHSHGSLVAYTAWLVDASFEDAPLHQWSSACSDGEPSDYSERPSVCMTSLVEVDSGSLILGDPACHLSRAIDSKNGIDFAGEG
jgi:hypothetical protein